MLNAGAPGAHQFRFPPKPAASRRTTSFARRALALGFHLAQREARAPAARRLHPTVAMML